MYYGIKTPYGINHKFVSLKGLNMNWVDQESLEGIDKIRQNILVLLQTRKGSRFMEPEIGSRLEDYLFEPNDFILRDLLEISVTEVITKNIDGITVDYVDIEQDYDAGLVKIKVGYLINSLGKYDEIILYKERPLQQT